MGRGKYLKAKATRNKSRKKEKCRKKRSFPDYDSALSVNWNGMVAYQCPFCKQYHIGHINRPPTRR